MKKGKMKHIIAGTLSALMLFTCGFTATFAEGEGTDTTGSGTAVVVDESEGTAGTVGGDAEADATKTNDTNSSEGSSDSTDTGDATVESETDPADSPTVESTGTVSEAKSVDLYSSDTGDDQNVASLSIEQGASGVISNANWRRYGRRVLDANENVVETITCSQSFNGQSTSLTVSASSEAEVGSYTIQYLNYSRVWNWDTWDYDVTSEWIGEYTVQVTEHSQSSKNYLVYVYVAGNNSDGTLSDECLELLGIDKDTLDGEGYFPVGEISLTNYLDLKGYTNASQIPQNQPLINNLDEWNAIKADVLASLNKDTLYGKFAENKDNTVAAYIDNCTVTYGSQGGDQTSTMMRRNDSSFAGSYGFNNSSEANIRLHLDLCFDTKKINFVFGTNNISTGKGMDATYAYTAKNNQGWKVYIKGAAIQDPNTESDPLSNYIPDDYEFDGYYKDKEFTQQWDGIGSPLNEDTTVYIKLKKKSQTLEIQKIIGGSIGDKTKTFSFTVSSNLGMKVGDTDYASNVAYSFSLTDYDSEKGNSAKITVPVGATVTIKEVDGDYSPSVEVGGTTVTGKANDDATEYTVNFTMPNTDTTATFTNTKEINPDTGIFTDMSPYIAMLGIVAVGTVIMMFTHKHRHAE